MPILSDTDPDLNYFSDQSNFEKKKSDLDLRAKKKWTRIRNKQVQGKQNSKQRKECINSFCYFFILFSEIKYRWSLEVKNPSAFDFFLQYV